MAVCQPYWFPTVCFTREAIEACCGVHNFLEERKVDMPDDAMQVGVAQAMPQDEADLAGTGVEVRDLLTSWIAEN
jgi:hypothetical protein